jgi:outer membrane protein
MKKLANVYPFSPPKIRDPPDRLIRDFFLSSEGSSAAVHSKELAMKWRPIFLMLACLLSGHSVFAGQIGIDRFLSHYKPSPVALTGPMTSDRLQGFIRNGEIPLSMNDLIGLTLENNLDIRVSRLNPVASEYAIRTNYRPFEAILTIDANITSDASRSRTQLTGVDSVSQFVNNFSVGYFDRMQTGTDLALEFTVNRTATNDAFRTFNPAWFTSMRYQVTQHVLNGFGRNVNTRSIRIAKNNKTVSDAEFERMVMDLVSQASKSYWDLVFAAVDIKIKRDSLALAEKTLSDNQIQVDVGALAKIELVQSKTQVATRREELIVSTSTQMQIQDQVKKVLSRDPDPGLVLAKISPTQDPNAPAASDILEPADAIRVALENRPERRQAALQLQNSEIEVEYAKNQLLPILDITASYTHSGVGGTQTIRNGLDPAAPPISIIRGGAGGAFADLLNNHSRGYAFGFNLQIPVSNRSRQAEYSRVTVEKKTSEENIRALDQQIALEVRNAITNVEMNKARVEAASLSRELAKEQMEAEQRRFELGASTVRFVLEEQRNFEQMQTNENAALINYRKALVDYDRALGVTLKRNNINIEKTVAVLK